MRVHCPCCKGSQTDLTHPVRTPGGGYTYQVKECPGVSQYEQAYKPGITTELLRQVYQLTAQELRLLAVKIKVELDLRTVASTEGANV